MPSGVPTTEPISTRNRGDAYCIKDNKLCKMLYNQLIQQSTLCAYMTTFKVFAVCCFLLIPFMFILKGEEKKAGRKELENDQKSEKTIANRESMN